MKKLQTASCKTTPIIGGYFFLLLNKLCVLTELNLRKFWAEIFYVLTEKKCENSVLNTNKKEIKSIHEP